MGRSWYVGRPPPDVLAGIPQNFPFAPFFTKFVNSCLILRYPETPYMRHFLLNAPPARNTTAAPLLTGPLAFFSNRTKYYQYFLISQKAPLNDSLTWPAPFLYHRQNFIRPRYSDCILIASITRNMNMRSFF